MDDPVESKRRVEHWNDSYLMLGVSEFEIKDKLGPEIYDRKRELFEIMKTNETFKSEYLSRMKKLETSADLHTDWYELKGESLDNVLEMKCSLEFIIFASQYGITFPNITKINVLKTDILKGLTKKSSKDEFIGLFKTFIHDNCPINSMRRLVIDLDCFKSPYKIISEMEAIGNYRGNTFVFINDDVVKRQIKNKK